MLEQFLPGKRQHNGILCVCTCVPEPSISNTEAQGIIIKFKLVVDLIYFHPQKQKSGRAVVQHHPLSDTWPSPRLSFQKDCTASDPCSHRGEKKEKEGSRFNTDNILNEEIK